MERNYALAVQKRENLYRAYINKAQIVLQSSGGKHTSEECQYLQRAAELQSEMADMTIGEERNHHLREKEAISAKVIAILKEIDPKKAAELEGGKGEGKKPRRQQAAEAAITIRKSLTLWRRHGTRRHRIIHSRMFPVWLN